MVNSRPYSVYLKDSHDFDLPLKSGGVLEGRWGQVSTIDK